jgi:hypothetical protein
MLEIFVWGRCGKDSLVVPANTWLCIKQIFAQQETQKCASRIHYGKPPKKPKPA